MILKAGELVVAEINEVHSNSIDAKLVEFDNKRAFLNVANIPGLWIRDVKKFMKKGDLIVAKVIRVGEQAELSMKKVSKSQSEKRLERFRKETKSVRMFRAVSKEFKIDDGEVDSAINQLKEKYGGVYESLRAMRESDEDLGLKDDFSSVIGRFGLGEKTYEFKGELELHSNEGDGVERIQDALRSLGSEIEATYIGNSRFLLKYLTKDPKKGEKTLENKAQKAIEKIKSLGGTGEYKKVK